MMKRFFILTTVIMLFLLSSCSSKQEAADVGLTEQSALEITQEELNQLFQEVFDEYGDIHSQEMSQILNELSALKSMVDTDVLPGDYEASYKIWRSGKVMNFERMIEQLTEEYRQIILKDVELVNAWDNGKNVTQIMLTLMEIKSRS